MRFILPSVLTLTIAGLLSSPAQAGGGDDSCVPRWDVFNSYLDLCNNFPYLNPGNDSRVNLRLLLADEGVLPLTPNALDNRELQEG